MAVHSIFRPCSAIGCAIDGPGLTLVGRRIYGAHVQDGCICVVQSLRLLPAVGAESGNDPGDQTSRLKDEIGERG